MFILWMISNRALQYSVYFTRIESQVKAETIEVETCDLQARFYITGMAVI